jgi:UDP-3-O-[3-hydroxymyristoyl] glucosamine N-acyltransferase
MVEDGCVIGDGTSVWDHVHIRYGTHIGEQCIIGGKSYIAYEVRIGNRCKINSAVYLCTGVTLEDGVMISAGTIFTNDRFKRHSDVVSTKPSVTRTENLTQLRHKA